MGHESKFELIAIPYSHYVEKVRWTLDCIGIRYRQKSLMPILHFAVTPFIVGLRGESDSHSTKFSTPILKTDRGETLVQSSRIVKYLSERFLEPENSLYPSKEVVQLDEYYNFYLGPCTRTLFYFSVFKNPEIIFDLAKHNVSKAQAKLFITLFPFFQKRLKEGLKISHQRANQERNYIYQEFERVGERLSDGRPFLFGEKITAADISFACLGGAIMLPSQSEGYGAYLPPLPNSCKELQTIAEDLRQSNAGQWVLNLYRYERGKKVTE